MDKKIQHSSDLKEGIYYISDFNSHLYVYISTFVGTILDYFKESTNLYGLTLDFGKTLIHIHSQIFS